MIQQRQMLDLNQDYDTAIDKVFSIMEKIDALPTRGGYGGMHSFTNQKMTLRIQLMRANSEAVEIDRQRNYLTTDKP